MLQPAEGLRLDIQVGGNIFLRHPLEHMGMGPDIFQEAFARTLLQLVEITEILSDIKVRHQQSPQTFGLGLLLIQLLKTVEADGNEYGVLDRLYCRPGWGLRVKGKL